MPDDHVPFEADSPFDEFFADEHDMLCRISSEGSLEWATSAWQHTLGWSMQDLLERSLLDRIHPDDRADFLTALKARESRTDPTWFRCRARRRLGGYSWLEWRVLEPARHGVIAATVRDVSEHCRTVLHAAELEKMSGIGSWEIDVETGNLFWSPATYAIHEVDPGFRPRLEDGIAFYPPEALPDLLPAVEELMASGTAFDLELPFVTAKSRRIWVRATAVAQMRYGKPVRLYGTFRDVTAERERRLLLERLECVSRKTSSVVFVTDSAFQFLWVNPAFERLTGYSQEEAIGRTILDLLPVEEPEQQRRKDIRDEIRAGNAVKPVLYYKGKSGNVFWLEHDTQPLFDSRGEFSGIVSVCKDITDARADQERIRAAEAATRLAMSRLESAVGAVCDGLYLFDADDRLVLARNGALETFPDLVAAAGPGATFEEIATTGLARGVMADAVGRETEWLAQRRAMHRGGAWEAEEWLRDGRCLRMIDRPMPDGGRVLFKFDITEAKRQERRLRDIITATGAITWERDLTKAEITFSDTWFEHLGYGREDACATWTAFEALVHPDDLPAARQLLERRIAGDARRTDLEYRVRRKDGSWSWMQDRGSVVRRAPDGTPILASGTLQDISARKESEARLRAAELEATAARQELLDAIEALDDGFILFDAEDRMVLFNHRIAEIFAANAEGIRVGVRFEDILRGGVRRGIFPNATGREEAWIETFLAERRSGAMFREERLSNGHWFRIIDRATANGGVIGLRIDVTELTESRRRLEAVITATRAGTWESDFRTGKMIVNDYWAEMLGYDHDEVPDDRRFFMERVHPDDMPRLRAEVYLRDQTSGDSFEL